MGAEWKIMSFSALGVEDVTYTSARKLQFLSRDNLNKFYRL